MRLLREPQEICRTPLTRTKDMRSFMHKVLRKGLPKILIETPFIQKEQFKTILIEQISTSIFDLDRLIVGQKIDALLLGGFMIFGVEPIKKKNNIFECRYQYYKII